MTSLSERRFFEELGNFSNIKKIKKNFSDGHIVFFLKDSRVLGYKSIVGAEVGYRIRK